MGTYQSLEVISQGSLSYSSKAIDGAGRPVVLKDYFTRFLTDYGGEIDLSYEVLVLLPDLIRLAALPPTEGLAPWTDFEVIDARMTLRFVRPFFPHRLIDLFPPAPHELPSPAFLQAFCEIAKGFDALSQHFPDVSFFLHPNNLLSNGIHAVVCDYGLVNLFNILEGGYEEPRVGLPYRWCCEAAGCFGIEHPFTLCSKRRDIKPVFALAALYFYLRIGHGVFTDSSLPTDLAHNFHTMIDYWPEHSRVEDYLEHDTLFLDELMNDTERRILAQALAPNTPVRSCTEFVDELQKYCIGR